MKILAALAMAIVDRAGNQRESRLTPWRWINGMTPA
jgi:hypothetical protein